MYAVRLASQADILSWNQYILGIDDNPCYLFYEFRFVVEKTYRAKTLLLIAEDEQKNIVGILFSYYLNRPNATLYTPEFGLVSNSDDVFISLIKTANKYCFDNNLSRSFFTTGNTNLMHCFNGERSEERHWIKHAFILDLTSGHEELWNRLSSSSRNKIRKAEKYNIKIASSLDYFDQFYKLYVECYSKKRFNIKSRAFFNCLLELLESRLDLFVCLYNDEVVSGALFLRNNSMCSYLYNASHPDSRNLGVNDFLIWEAAKYYVGRGHRGINLGESIPGSGAYRFKAKQLKCSPCDVHYYSYLNPQLNTAAKFSAISQKVKEKLVILLCKSRYTPFYLMKRLLIKRALFGRFL